MKKTLLILLCCLWAAGACAQKAATRPSIHELRFGYGGYTSHGILSGATEMLPPLEGSDRSYGRESRSGSFYLSYRCRLLPKFRLGATLAYDKVSKDYLYRVGEESRLVTNGGKNRFFTVAADAQFNYLQTSSGVLSLYWALSAGATFHKQRLSGAEPSRRSRTMFAYQFSPLGMTLGANQLGAFAELGFGYRGILQIGIYGRF